MTEPNTDADATWQRVRPHPDGRGVLLTLDETFEDPPTFVPNDVALQICDELAGMRVTLEQLAGTVRYANALRQVFNVLTDPRVGPLVYTRVEVVDGEPRVDVSPGDLTRLSTVFDSPIVDTAHPHLDTYVRRQVVVGGVTFYDDRKRETVQVTG